jgi:hypothetical protein
MTPATTIKHRQRNTIPINNPQIQMADFFLADASAGEPTGLPTDSFYTAFAIWKNNHANTVKMKNRKIVIRKNSMLVEIAA